MELAKQQVKLGIIGVNRICQLCGISKATYYSAQDPQDKFLTKYQQNKGYVEKIINQHGYYGIRRIKVALLQKYQIVIGRDTLAKLLNLWGLSLKRKMKKRKRSMIDKILLILADKANLLKRIKLTVPLQALSSDMTKILYAEGKNTCYLSVHKDVKGQMVYGHEISENMTTELVLGSLRKAIKKIKWLTKIWPKKLLFHQDRGSQYTSYEYVAAVLQVGQLSYSTPGTPTDNPGQESFFGRFKDECRHELWELQSLKEVKKFINKKIRYYNNQRIHTSISYQTPISYTKSFLFKH